MENNENNQILDASEQTPDTSAHAEEESVAAAEDAVEESGAAAEDAVSGAGEDSVYDAQDLSPTAIRRGRMVVGIMLFLGVVAIVVLILMPPLSWKPPKKQKQNFEPLSVVESVEQGAGERVSLSYAPVETLVYAVELEQDTRYASDRVMHSALSGHLELHTPQRKDLAETVGIRLKEAVMRVKDGERDIELGESGEMLSGVSLYARMDVHEGMGRAVPDSNINPQVARVMYILTDALRYMWPALPVESVGEGATWRLSDVVVPGGTYIRSATARLKSAKDNRFETETTIELLERRDGRSDVVGSGTAVVRVENGWLQDGQLTLNREGGEHLSGAQSQQIRMKIELK